MSAHEAKGIRNFIRHPSGMPIRIHCAQTDRRSIRNLSNIGIGGLACESDEPMPIGSDVTIEIPLHGEPFRASGEVCWCRWDDGCYEIGVRFTNSEEAFAARMVEQLCQIEHYRDTVRHREGRDIDSAEAAIEWINLHAANFPAFN